MSRLTKSLSTVVGRFARTGPLAFLMVLSACGGGSQNLDPPLATKTGKYGNVDQVRLDRADEEPGNWYTNGRDGDFTYHSPLRQINDGNVDKLGFAWEYDLGSARGQEATPIVVDGIMYTVGIWGRVYALDAVTGKELWTYDPEVDGQYGRNACCDVVQRGIVVWKGVVYSGSTDAFLHAVDAKTGARIWKVDTLPEGARGGKMLYSSSGSPVVAGDKIVLGNSGADLGVRGFFTAFDLKTGRFAWRFYTVPRDPKLGPQESKALDMAVKTWDPDGSWKTVGGGGTVWDGMSYDAKRDLLFVGTGNASPLNPQERSPKGGDNLFLASVLAIKATTGELVWYYQQVPGEAWDFNANQKFILATIEVKGKPRDVIMQAPKNGFFYVFDRQTGERLAINAIARVNWLDGFDANGKPKISAQADYNTGPKLIAPGPSGNHAWHPMSRDPRTGLVFVPTHNMPFVYFDNRKGKVNHVDVYFSLGGVDPANYDPEYMKQDFIQLPPFKDVVGDFPKADLYERGELKAIDPMTGKVRWSHSSKFREGGVMTTAGNLLFQGYTDGTLNVYASDTGKLLKQIETGSGIMAAPMTYAVNGKQYVAVMTGLGGGKYIPFAPGTAAYKYGNANRILVFALDGGNVPIPPVVKYPPIAMPPAQNVSQATIDSGRRLFISRCSRCHTFGPGLVPDLRRMAPGTHEQFENIVLRGLLAPNGMGRFDDVLSSKNVKDIHAYLIDETARAAKGGPGTQIPPRSQ